MWHAQPLVIQQSKSSVTFYDPLSFVVCDYGLNRVISVACNLCMEMSMTIFCCFPQECLEFFNIPEARSAQYFLMDKRWNLIHYAKVQNI